MKKSCYLTMDWWRDLDGLVTSECESAELVVEHRVGEQLHTQYFGAGRLLAWSPGGSPAPTLQIVRPPALDAGDLLGRLPSEEVWLGTVVSKPVLGSQTDLLGIGPRLGRLVPLLEGLEPIVLQLAVLNGPIGSWDAICEVGWEGVTLGADRSRVPDVRVRLPYEEMLSWLHEGGTPVNLAILEPGPLRAVAGDFTLLSAVAGVLGSIAEVPQQAHQHVPIATALAQWARYRRSPSYMALCELVDDFTA